MKSRNSESASTRCSAACTNLWARDFRNDTHAAEVQRASCGKGIRASIAESARLRGDSDKFGRALLGSAIGQGIGQSSVERYFGGGRIGK